MTKKKTLIQVVTFVAILALFATIAVLSMPKERVWAYAPATVAYDRVGSLAVKKVDASGNELNGATISLKYQRFNPDGSAYDDTFGNNPSTLNIGTANITNAYLEQYRGDKYTFNGGYEAKAEITITEIQAPTGYQKLSQPIILEYSYDGRTIWGNVYPSEGYPYMCLWNVLKVSIKNAEDLGDAVELQEKKVSFNNDTYTDYTLLIKNDNTSSIKVSKELAGDDTDPNKEFEFTVNLTDKDGNALANKTFDSGDDAVTTDANGKATLKLQGGVTKTISDLPEGTKYTIEEADYTSEGYEAVSWTLDGKEVTGNPSGQVAIDDPIPTYVATNTKNKKDEPSDEPKDDPKDEPKDDPKTPDEPTDESITPDSSTANDPSETSGSSDSSTSEQTVATGDESHMMEFMGLMSLCAIALIAVTIIRRKRREE